MYSAVASILLLDVHTYPQHLEDEESVSETDGGKPPNLLLLAGCSFMYVCMLCSSPEEAWMEGDCR